MNDRTRRLAICLPFFCATSNAAPAQCDLDPLAVSEVGAEFGCSLALDGGRALIGARFATVGTVQSGAALVYDRSVASGWRESDVQPSLGSLPLGSQRGRSVAMEGDYVVLGVPRADDLGSDSGRVEVYKQGPWGGWTRTVVLPQDGHAGHLFGWDVAVSGEMLLVTARDDSDAGTNAGAVYLFSLSTGTPLEVTKLTPPAPAAGDLFGWSIDVDAGIAVIGAYGDDDAGSGAGAAYLYRGDASGLALEAKLVPAAAAAQSFTGASVATHGGRVLLGAYGADVGGVVGAGRAHLYEEVAGAWAETHFFSSPSATADDGFGYSVALDGDRAAFSSRGDVGGSASHSRVWWAESTFLGWGPLEDVTPPGMASPGSVRAVVALDGADLLAGSPELGPGGAVFPVSLRRFPSSCRRVLHSRSESETWVDSGWSAGYFWRDAGDLDGLASFGESVAEIVDLSMNAYASYHSAATFCAADFPSSVVFPHQATGAMNVAVMAYGNYPICSYWECPNVIALSESTLSLTVTHAACDGWDLGRGVGASLEVGDFYGLERPWTFSDLHVLALCFENQTDYSVTPPFIADSAASYYLTGSLDLDFTLGVDVDFYPRDLPEPSQWGFCQSNINSSGRSAELYAGGSATVTENQLYLSAVDLPPGVFGLLVMSGQPGFVALFGGGQGNLCLGGTIYRFNDVQQASASGDLGLRVDLSALPQGQTVTAGQTTYFQYWFRDRNPQLTSNTSNGLAIAFE